MPLTVTLIGDTADKIRKMVVVRLLGDISAQHRSHKDLSTSFTHLRDGIELLRLCLDESEPDQKAATDPTPEDQVGTSRMSCVAQSVILSDASELSRGVEKLKINFTGSEMRGKRPRKLSAMWR